jgi:hypothetical protein
MAYIGRGIQWGEFAKQNIGTGVNTPLFDGSETGPWALDFSSNENSLLVVLDGQIQEPGVDFTVVTGTTNFNFITAPATGKNCYIIYLGQELTSMSNPSMANLQAAIDAAEVNITNSTVDEAIAYSLAFGSLG